ncbi:MAG TPA: ABC transporter ATP-binding protein [Planctomycetaceae bacterium]|nr:ABC transporter ATP-binding protein [Planctomycetaceae bacterium]HRF01527.1 ABC transporter ATP-binding protein [Pirellulaceae bacterium]
MNRADDPNPENDTPASDSAAGASLRNATDALIELRGVTIRFGKQTVLRNLDLAIPAGQTLAVIGESGCGKSVLMKTVIGLIRPTEGQVFFDGVDLATLDEKSLARVRIRFGYVFQNAALFDSMTVGQNIAFPLRQHADLSPAQIDDVVAARLAEVGLPRSVLAKKPAELSGGMRKRVGLARALVLNPEVVLYDEPTTGLDPIMSDVINELMLRTRHRYTVTGIVVTHDMTTARKVPDRVVMLYPIARLDEDEPQMIYDGRPDRLESVRDRRVRQFVAGEAGQRLSEMQQEGRD